MKTALIDGNALLHRTMRVGPLAGLTNRHGKPTGGFFAALKSIHGMLCDYKIDSSYVVFDSGISKRRRELLPEYKGARYRSKEDPLFEEMDEETRVYLTMFRVQRSMLQYILPRLGTRVVRLKEPHGWEADDVIFALSKLVPSSNVTVFSDDKDMLQIIFQNCERHLHLVRPIAKQYITQDDFEDCVGYPQRETLLRKAILGDASDNISKVPGCGKKGVDSIFLEGAPVCEYPFEDFLVWCMDHPYKKVQAIANHMNILLRNYELMDLTLEDMSEAEQQLKDIIKEPVSVDLTTVKRFMTELDLVSIVKELHTWAIAFQRLR